MFTGGIALSCLALSAMALDRRTEPPPRSRPFESLGKNAILIFVASGLVAKTLLLFPAPGGESAHAWIWQALFASFLGPLHGSLAFALTQMAAWTAVAVLLDRRRIYFKV